jgi:hypothetical protein
MNYNYEDGIIGTYKNVPVKTIEYVFFTKEEAEDKSVIFAVKNTDSSGDLALIYQGYIIGYMTYDGRIKIDPHNRAFKFYKPKKEEVKEEYEPAEVKDYSAYTTVVDNFFEGLNELWKEMEV